MAELAQILQALQGQHAEQMSVLQAQLSSQQAVMAKIVASVTNPAIPTENQVPGNTAAAIPKFSPFDSTVELWADYWSRFLTFLGANSVPNSKKGQVFLTNQLPEIFKLISNLAAQQSPPKTVSDLSLEEISDFMKDQYDPKRFVVRERFKFWSKSIRKPGESIQELAARIRQKAATCNFPEIKDPLDEAMRTNFICSINNEAVLKALFKVDDDKLTFSKAVDIAIEVEEAAKCAKETIYGETTPIFQVKEKSIVPTYPSAKNPSNKFEFLKNSCARCGSKQHKSNVCKFLQATCHYCQKERSHCYSVF